mgnify:CR=1 FL=1
MALLIANADSVWPPDMDEICKRMTAVLMSPRASYRYNELKRRFNAVGITESRLTIIQHINPLIDKHLVIKPEVSSKEVVLF